MCEREYIVTEMRARKISTNKLSQISGVDRGTIRSMLRGTAKTKPDTYTALLFALELDEPETEEVEIKNQQKLEEIGTMAENIQILNSRLW